MPKLSYAGKTLIFEGSNQEIISRRDFLKKATIVVAGVSFFSIVLNGTNPGDSEATVTCCYVNCFNECHSNCGRKTW